MEKKIKSVSTKNAGKNGVDYFITTTIVEVSRIENANQHKEAREELQKVKAFCTGHSVYSFQIIDADFNSFTAKTFGNVVSQLEEIGYTF